MQEQLFEFKYFSFSHFLLHAQANVLGFHVHPSLHICRFIEFLNSYQHLSLAHIYFNLHPLPSNLHLQSHETCFANDLDSFTPAIIYITFNLTTRLLFRIQNLAQKSSRYYKFQHTCLK